MSSSNSRDIANIANPLQVSNIYLPEQKKLFGIYWFHYSAMVNGSDLGEVANWKGGMGAHCQSDLQGSWASEKKLVKYARDMKYSSYLC